MVVSERFDGERYVGGSLRERDRWIRRGTNLPGMRKEVVAGDGVLWRRRLLQFEEWGGEKIESLGEVS